jgi:kinesin family protein 13
MPQLVKRTSTISSKANRRRDTGQGTLEKGQNDALEEKRTKEELYATRDETLQKANKSKTTADSLRSGDRVSVEGYGCMGSVRYVGPHKTDVKKGIRVLVQLDLPVGKNNGTVGSSMYCKTLPTDTGVLVSAAKVAKYQPKAMQREDSDA